MSEKQKSEKSETPENSEGTSTNHSGSCPIDELFLKSGIEFIVDDSLAGQSFVWPAMHWPSKPQKPAESTPPPADEEENKI